jgi:trimeric autotransporter adhesin
MKIHTRKNTMNHTNTLIKTLIGWPFLRFSSILLAIALACFGLLPRAQAVVPAPDGGYPGGNTAEGQTALLSLTSGQYNTAVGVFSLLSNTEGNFNTGLGAGTLLLNTGEQNTATGAGALLSNTTGVQNSAHGAFALFSNTEGSFNTATGDQALFSNTGGEQNTATGFQALTFNTTGALNTATGSGALRNNTTGFGNTATGGGALASNTEGPSNTANGYFALNANTTGANNVAVGNSSLEHNTTGTFNTALGFTALQNNTTGVNNTALGFGAGSNQNIGSNNIYIGDMGAPTESNVIKIGAEPSSGTPYEGCYVGGIVGIGPFASTVTIDPVTGQLGELVSSKQFKKDIDPMGTASEAIFSLKPVTFHYKKDKTNTPQFGLIAEEVAKVNPALIGVDKEGKPHTVRYEQINAMLLNEFLKEHKKVEEQEATITELKHDFQMVNAQQQKEIQILSAQLKEQAARIEKVSAQLEIAKPATKLVHNKP